MKYCDSCGGLLGRDCFNPSECAWIAEEQERRARIQQHERNMQMHHEMKAATAATRKVKDE